jgi:hypothetical protein
LAAGTPPRADFNGSLVLGGVGRALDQDM